MTLMRKLFVCIILALTSWAGLNAQEITIRGTVVDFYTQKPLEYIPVYIKHTATGCLRSEERRVGKEC